MAVSNCITSSLCLIVFLTSVLASKKQEISENEVSVRFDKINVKKWEADEREPTDQFKDVVAKSVTSYCSGSDCSLGTNTTASGPFTADDVIVNRGPVDENADVQFVFHVSIEGRDKPDTGNQYALKKSVLEAILKEYKLDIENATGYMVVFIGNERVGAPLDGTLNSIMIPIAIAALVILVIVTVFLHFNEKWHNKANGLGTNKRTDIPGSAPHDEGIVLTSVNKGSSAASSDKNSQRSVDKETASKV